ncbi:MAG TPA: phospholipase D-like domain-containing protein [Gemmataceae bacterium]|nr:phospholipase D-like domain-containing protein [Gemmataceae bacterium]
MLDLAGLLHAAHSTPPSSGQLQRALSLSTVSAAQLARGLDQVINSTGVTVRDVQTALMTLACTHSTGIAQTDTVEIACTAPTRLGVPLRTTYATALEMVEEAQNEILVVGYVFTEGAKSLLERVARASRDRRVRVTVIGNRMEEYLSALRSIWPSDCPGPRAFSCQGNPRDEMSALHAKLLVCDGATALVTSANFSHHGLHENIEIGVKINSSSVARLVEFFNSLIVARQVTQGLRITIAKLGHMESFIS